MAVRQAILLTVFVLSAWGDVPYCQNQIPLDKNNFDPLYGWDPIVKCRLHQYRSQDVVRCLDIMSSKINRKFHILVIGDSRIRQQFFELLSHIPDYDIEWSNFTQMRGAIHYDVDVDSSINNLRFSFHWRPLIDGALYNDMLHLTDHLDDAPDFILFGVGSHHMIHYNRDNHRWFRQELERLAPVLNKLTRRTRVVWWTQNPVIEYFTGPNSFGSQVTDQKLTEYERSARKILRNTGVEIWDSGVPMAEEYIRGCSINKRWDGSNNRECSDSLHTGYLALFRGSQFLLNSLCNSFIFT